MSHSTRFHYSALLLMLGDCPRAGGCWEIGSARC